MNQYVDEGKFFEFFNNEIEGDLPLFFRLQTHFHNHIEEFRKCKTTSINSNLEELCQAAHKLKSSCSSFGALRMAELLENLESLAKQNETQQAIENYKHCLEAIGVTKMELQHLIDGVKK